MKEAVLLKVNNQEIKLGRLFSLMKLTGLNKQLDEKLVNGFLIEQASKSAGLNVTDEELQEEIDEQRAQMGLFAATDTYQWLGDNNLVVEDLEAHCEFNVLKKKFRDYITKGKVEEYFTKNLLDLESAEISQLVVAEDSAAHELLMQIRDGEAEFEALARKYSNDESAKKCGYLGTVTRGMLNSEFEGAVFSAQDADIIGPLESDLGFHIIQVHSINHPSLDEETSEMIKDRILDEWLDLESRKAQIDYIY